MLSQYNTIYVSIYIFIYLMYIYTHTHTCIYLYTHKRMIQNRNQHVHTVGKDFGAYTKLNQILKLVRSLAPSIVV